MEESETLIQEGEKLIVKVNKLLPKHKAIFIAILLGLIIVFAIIGILFSDYKERQLVKATTERVESEMRFKQSVAKEKQFQLKKDTLISEINDLRAEIEYAKNNPTKIIQNNEKTKMDINKLDAYNSIKLFTSNVSKYEHNRERYNLKRFNKNN